MVADVLVWCTSGTLLIIATVLTNRILMTALWSPGRPPWPVVDESEMALPIQPHKLKLNLEEQIHRDCTLYCKLVIYIIRLT